MVLLVRLGPVLPAPYPLSGFIRASLPSGRTLFQVRAPGGEPRSLTELAPLACFLTGVPILRLRFVDAPRNVALSLTPQLPAISWSNSSPFLSLSLASWDALPA